MAVKNGHHPAQPLRKMEYPASFTDKYSKSDQVNVHYIVDWMNENAKRRASLARLANMNNGTLHLLLKGSYTGTVEPKLAMLVDACNRFDDRKKISRVPFVETSVYKLVSAGCHRAHNYKSFVVITGDVGTGKTRSLKEYAHAHPSAILLEADPDMSPITLLHDLIVATNAPVIGRKRDYMGTKNAMLRAVIKHLEQATRLIIVDEAETMQANCLEYLRRIRDKAGVGVVLAGTPRLKALIQPEHGQFDQIRSRVNFWPQTVHGITKKDAEQVVLAGLADHLDDVDDSVQLAFWKYSGGSIRVITESLIPAVRNYGLEQGHDLCAQLVEQIAREVLTLSPSERS